MTWATTSGRQLPPHWNRTRATVLRRDPVCRCEGCPYCTPRGCKRPSTDCDHIGRANDHNPANLRGLCSPCHNHRSAHQGQRARKQAPPRTEPHPGTQGGPPV